MIDITTKRTMAAQMHPPRVIYVMLVALGLVGALIAGYSMAARKKRSLLHVLSFAVTTTLAVFVIIDMEYPRYGLIKVAGFDSALVDLRNRMND